MATPGFKITSEEIQHNDKSVTVFHLSGAYIYRSNEGGMWFTSTVANPILPEGAFRISLE